MAATILIVEDEEQIARFLELELMHEGYTTCKADNGRSGLETAQSGECDLVLLDVMLPELNGLEVLRRLRRTSNLPVIMLTARDAVMVRMFITNLKSTLKIRLKAHIFPRTFADLLPLCYDYNTKH